MRRLSTDIEVVNALAGSALAKARDGRVAEARATLAQAERALAWLRRFAPKEHLHFQQHLRCDPPFAPIAGDPRFRALLIPSMPEPGRDC